MAPIRTLQRGFLLCHIFANGSTGTVVPLGLRQGVSVFGLQPSIFQVDVPLLPLQWSTSDPPVGGARVRKNVGKFLI